MPVILDSSEIKVIDGDKNFTIETVKSNVIVNQDTEINEPIVPLPQLETSVSSETIDETYKYLSFTHSGGSEDQTEYSLNFNIETECDILIVGGGGGGGARFGGGGGAGLLIYKTNQTLQSDITIKIGKGGLGGQNGSGSLGSNGEDSIFISSTETLTAIGGGGGGKEYANGKNGGSGGGGSYQTSTGGTGSGDGITSFGNAGSNGYLNGFGTRTNGGGGGAGGAGIGNTMVRPDGGRGKQIDITGTNIYYAGGGGGANSDHDTYGQDATGQGGENLGSGWGGMGGGGGGDGGETSPSIPAQNGAPNSGGGGGGGVLGSVGGNGGSGIVIIRYKVIDLVMEPKTLTHYTPERMYPPIHNFTNDNTLVYGESYGNGVYELSASSHWRLPDFSTYNLFLSSIVKIWHGATRYTSNGIYNGSDYIVPGYLGDWIKIKLPRPIKLTKYGLSLPNHPIERAPGKYKLYGSNDGTNWDVLVHKRNTVSYDTSFSFEERVNVNNQYQYFGLVINELVGNSTYLNLETLYIYGKEFISEDPEYKTLAFEHEAVEDLVYDFTPYNSLTSWETYAESIPGYVGGVSSGFSSGGTGFNIGVWNNDPISQIGYISFPLPAGYDTVSVYYGNVYAAGTTEVLINDVLKQSCSPGQFKTYTTDTSGFYVVGHYIKIQEVAGIIAGDMIITFSNTQTEYTVNFPQDTECDILIVGGGGGGGGNIAGGGGGGGVAVIEKISLSGNYTIKVGKGGSKNIAVEDGASDGKNSLITNTTNTLEVIGGGGGGHQYGIVEAGNNGGSGGGGCGSGNPGNSAGGSSQTGNKTGIFNTATFYGKNGGIGANQFVPSGAYFGAGGGGGANVDGGDGLRSASTLSTTLGGKGGDGIDMSYIFETNVGDNGYFAGGGGGGQYTDNSSYFTFSEGGLGGGGKSAFFNTVNAEDGQDNTGGGGGGGSYHDQNGGNGGSGIVIIRYKTQYQATTHGAQWTYHSANPNTHHYGNVGIGTVASATQKLLVNGDMNVTGNYKQNDNTIGNWYKAGTSIYRASGNVGIGNTAPQYSLHVHGGVYAGEGGTTGDGTTVWTSTSDSRMKENIFKASYKECYDIFKKIELYRYNFKPGHVNSNDRNQLGFIAQEVQQQIPNSVEPRSIRLSSGVYIHDILTLNVTQVNYILYGTFKYLIAELDIIKKHLESQEEAGQTE